MPNSDEAASQPPRPVAAGCNVFFLLVLLFLLAGLAFWGWQRNPPATPAPASTGTPSGPPVGNAT